jgi:Concanavalin A-like lectin/glucanases superfamily
MQRSTKVFSSVAAASALVLGFGDSARAATQVANWTMNDSGSTMADASGRGHTGTLHSVRVKQSGYAGSVGFGFFSKPSYVTVPSATDLNPGTGSFSYTVHVRFSVRPSTTVHDYDLLRKGLSTTSGGDYKMEILGSGAAYCEFKGSSGSGSLTGSSNLANNAWHTITCARTSSSIRLTVDGSTKSKTVSTGSISNSSTVYIGAKNSAGDDQYAGYMDAVTVSKG